MMIARVCCQFPLWNGFVIRNQTFMLRLPENISHNEEVNQANFCPKPSPLLMALPGMLFPQVCSWLIRGPVSPLGVPPNNTILGSLLWLSSSVSSPIVSVPQHVPPPASMHGLICYLLSPSELLALKKRHRVCFIPTEQTSQEETLTWRYSVNMNGIQAFTPVVSKHWNMFYVQLYNHTRITHVDTCHRHLAVWH